jgi:ERF superfamily
MNKPAENQSTSTPIPTPESNEVQAFSPERQLQLHRAILAEKLNVARALFHRQSLKKSGRNAYAGYNYFELADFMPSVLSACSDVGICGIVSFDKEFATLTLIDTTTGGTHEITSPMEGATLKGCHPIQNLGAVETYSRRYLWMAAFEIIEQDVLDSSEPTKPTAPPEPEKKAPVKPVKKGPQGLAQSAGKTDEDDVVKAARELFEAKPPVKTSPEEQAIIDDEFDRLLGA